MLLSTRNYYKPFTYPQFFDRWSKHERSHWSPSEVAMHDDINDWNNKLTDLQKDFLTNIFRFFTQGDIDVASAYYTEYLPYFKLPEVTMMLGGFAAREAIHIESYSYLIETLGMPEATYKEFLMYDEMKNKQDYIKKFSTSNNILLSKGSLTGVEKEHIAASIALFSGFTEGMQLFSTFAMLLIFPLNGLLKGMGKIIHMSIVDETQHTEGMIDLFKTFVSENINIPYRWWQSNPNIRLDVLKTTIYTIAREMVSLEESFIDLIFKKYSTSQVSTEPKGSSEESSSFLGLTPANLKKYIKYIADKRLIEMGYEGIFNISVNPLPKLEVMVAAPSHTNFFETRPTEYSTKAVTGSWKDVWK